MEQTFLEWVNNLAKQYKQTQINAFKRIDYELCKHNILLGKEIEESSFRNTYGSKFYTTLSAEMKKILPNAKGFSARNLRYIQSFYILYRKILQQLVAKLIPLHKDNLPKVEENEINEELIKVLSSLPWGHYVVIMDHCRDDINQAYFYVQKAVNEQWSRNTLKNLISYNLYERKGRALNNFSLTLKDSNNELNNDIVKDPYIFNTLELEEDFKEKDFKKALVKNIEDTLLEFGKGYSYVGEEYRITVGDSEFYIDMLFYYIPFHSYVVIEIKNSKFKPEHLGQLSFYVTAIDKNIKGKFDNPTIGILLCKDKDSDVVQYSLNNFHIPLGISSFKIGNLKFERQNNSAKSNEDHDKAI